MPTLICVSKLDYDKRSMCLTDCGPADCCMPDDFDVFEDNEK